MTTSGTDGPLEQYFRAVTDADMFAGTDLVLARPRSEWSARPKARR